MEFGQLVNCVTIVAIKSYFNPQSKIHNNNKNRWNDKDYNKRLLGSRWHNPFMGSSHAKGLVVEKFGVEAK